MPDDFNQPNLRLLRRIAEAGEIRRLTDGQLLERYATHRDEAAFELMVHRHGGMVWRVCRTVLGQTQATEDAFQATFFVLIRKASSLRQPELLGNWLYGVASRVARRARKTIVKRNGRELQGIETLNLAVVVESAESDLQLLLQEELRHLPTKYRSPIVLCYLEGRTNEEAAQQLGWPLGTVKVRLMRGRELLRTRLARRNLTVSGLAVVSLLSPSLASAVPAPILENTFKAALLLERDKSARIGVLSGQAVALAEGVINSMWWNKMTALAGGLLAIALLGAGLVRNGTTETPTTSKVAPSFVKVLVPNNAPKEKFEVNAELKDLQGTWSIRTLELNGVRMAENQLGASRIVVRGDSFTTISMGATYEGRLTVDVASTPKRFDLQFTEGPEKGNTSLGIYELDGDTWKLCFTVTGNERPKTFATLAGSGLAVEILQRETEEPGRVKSPIEQKSGGQGPDKPKGEDKTKEPDELAKLAGEWTMVSGEIDAQPLPEAMVKTGKRTVKENEVTAMIGGQILFRSTITVDPSKKPKTIDFEMTEGPTKGKIQYGIYELDGDTFRSCFSAPGKDRPTDFTTKAGDGRTLSLWKRVKK